MFPWSDKGSGSSSSKSTLLSRDENIANTSRFQQQRPTESFRANAPVPGRARDAYDAFQSDAGPPLDQLQSQFQPPAPPHIQLPSAPNVDGAEVQAFLNSADYTDEIHGDDLASNSHTYRSYRHEQDRQHSVAQQQLSRFEELLRADDIVVYLQGLSYTDDIYGAPPAIEDLIKEAREEVVSAGTTGEEPDAQQHRAVSRLTMVRNHLMGQAGGDIQVASRRAHEMSQDDWDRLFSRRLWSIFNNETGRKDMKRKSTKKKNMQSVKKKI